MPRFENLEDRLAPATFTVLNPNDSGAGSLRQAILDANANPGADLITFNIGGSGAHSIQPLSALPVITDAVTIDGYSQPGASANSLAVGDNAVLLVELNGSLAGNADGLDFAAGSCTVRGLVINGFAGSGIICQSGSGDDIEGNFIGTNAAGSAAVANGFAGVSINGGSGDTVGGPTPGARNVISGNTFFGVALSPASNNLVQGNYIGTNAAGTQAVFNGFIGVNIGDSSYNTIDGNLISGNGPADAPLGGPYAAVAIAQFFGSADYNTVTHNTIGLSADGSTPIPNTQGIFIGGGAQHTTIEANMISANIWWGVQVYGDLSILPTTPTSDTVLRGNTITNNGGDGVELAAGNGQVFDGTSFLGPTLGTKNSTVADNTISGNHGNGLVIDGIRADGNIVTGNTITNNSGFGVGILGGAQGNTIGGAGALGNVIAGNGGAGVLLGNDGLDYTPTPQRTWDPIIGHGAPLNNSIRGNSIDANAGLGIDLNGDGITANDAGDVDSGPGNLQNFPVISDVHIDGSGNLVVTYIVDSDPAVSGYPLTIDFYKGDDSGQGKTYLGSDTYTSLDHAAGTKTVVLGNAAALGYSNGDLVVATATDAAGNTSEFTFTPLGSLSGTVFVDFNNDGQIDFGEQGIAGVTVTLTGTDYVGQAVSRSVQTDADGAYLFLNLRPGSYVITETQPAGYPQGLDSVGTAGGSLVATDQFFAALPSVVDGVHGIDGLNYNFGERPPADGSVHQGQTATIGFWNNTNGQALIKSLNGGTGSHLADWLAVTLPNIFGANAGSSNLTGKSNDYVAALFQRDFLVKGVKLDAQLLATTLAVYATDSTLDSTLVAAQYGFTVSQFGVGAATINVGSNGAAFGVADNSVVTVLDLLLAANSRAKNGLLYDLDGDGNATDALETSYRAMANNVFSAINQAGDI
jgi:parallel beta-helix repeat protein